MAALREIPAFLQIVFVECMSQKVDLAEVESMGWPTNNTTHGNHIALFRWLGGQSEATLLSHYESGVEG